MKERCGPIVIFGAETITIGNIPLPSDSLPAIMTRYLRIFSVMLAGLHAPLAIAQFDPFSDPGAGAVEKSPAQRVTATLESGATAWVPGKPVDVALKLEHAEHWHTYWLNPGLGTPTTLKWELPAGWKTDEKLLWPVPEVKPTEVGNQHLYEGTEWLFTTVTPPADLKAGESITLKASAKWLVCDEGSVCVPGNADLTLTLPVAAAAEPVAAVMSELAKVRAQQPQVSPAWDVKLEPGWTVVLTPKEGANPDPGEIYFFDEKASITNDPQKVTKEGGVIKIAAAAGSGKNGDPMGYVHASKGWLQDGSVPSLAVGATSPSGAAGAAVTPAGGTESSTLEGTAAKVTFLGAVIGLFFAGMILNLMPCVFPVLALKVQSFIKQSGKDRSHTVRHSLAYTAGLLVFVWLIAGGMYIASRSFGSELAWGDFTRYSVVLACVVIVLFLLGLNLAGLFEIGTSLTSVGGELQDQKGYSGSFWSGALTLLISTPCSAPLMAAPMGFALKQGAVQQFVLFTVFGLGIALPYVVLSNSPRLLKRLPRPGAWMETFKKALSFPMFASAIFFFNAFVSKTGSEGGGVLLWALLLVALAAWIYGHWCLPSKTSRVRWIGGLTAVLALTGGVYLVRNASSKKMTAGDVTHVTGNLAWTRWSPETLAAERAKGNAVFVDYSTVGCVTCVVNENGTLSLDSVSEKFKQLNVTPLYAYYRADGTPEDDAIHQSLKPWGIVSYPVYLMYPADAGKPPFLVSSSALTPGMVIEALEKAVN